MYRNRPIAHPPARFNLALPLTFALMLVPVFTWDDACSGPVPECPGACESESDGNRLCGDSKTILEWRSTCIDDECVQYTTPVETCDGDLICWPFVDDDGTYASCVCNPMLTRCGTSCCNPDLGCNESGDDCAENPICIPGTWDRGLDGGCQTDAHDACQLDNVYSPENPTGWTSCGCTSGHHCICHRVCD